MKKHACPFLEACRCQPKGFESQYGKMEGFFLIFYNDIRLKVISSGKGDMSCEESVWEHVSVSIECGKRTPTWDEMCFVKRLFWEDEETVIQFHPSKSEYVNTHPFVLHLWKPLHFGILLPPKHCV